MRVTGHTREGKIEKFATGLKFGQHETYPDLLSISGAMYSTVPQKVKLSSSSELSLMQPKSVSLM